MVLGEVLEVLVEEVAVREGHHTAVQGRQLRTLVVDALYLPAHAVTLYIIAHAQAAGHELNPVEEVVQHILHRETDTRRESGGNQFQGRCRNLQVVQYNDEIEAPEGDGDEVVAQRQVYLAGLNLILAGFAFRLSDAADAEQGPEQIDEVSEQEIQREDDRQFQQRQLNDILVVQEEVGEVFHTDLGQVEHVGCHKDTGGNGPDGENRQEDHPDKIIPPGNLDKGSVVVQDLVGVVLLVFLHLGGQPLVIDLLQQIEQGGNGLDDSHLENPPDNDLDGQEYISAEGGHGGAGQDRQGKPHIEAVVFRQLGTEMQGSVQLPEGEA